ncbi:MBL fold metallo-hydrolase [Labedaea rhizosphaerae]|uniref:L-ascorbate metabolism protein UlaG (Beta-lactamase superfamily) n=1 Tax=Labedaea rhizosphaerae TaxID=598644 RepID=A0A4R6S0P9_LABRH|nr:MBL fold metallo-hydrolase [Labedaea rhizosphaerae]TDP92803.1 L-ascorbate metabolism protein UlaG (beta-lactamase superfamily) [Labedaea rhizosphaerae]
MALDTVAGNSLSFIGTATTLIKLGPFTLLTDPNFLHLGQWSYLGQGLISKRRTEPAIQPAELPPLTAVVLSHLHGDHFDRIASRELPKDVPIITTGHAAKRLRKRGFQAPQPLPVWSRQNFVENGARLGVIAVPARHARGPLRAILPPVMGSVLEYQAAGQTGVLRIYLSGDTVLFPGLAAIHERFPSLDHAVVHLGGTRVLGALVTMDHKQGTDLVELLEPRTVLPVHYDDYGLFTSPLSNFLAEFRARGLPTTLRVLQRGETVALE